jgi:hypothetical protein
MMLSTSMVAASFGTGKAIRRPARLRNPYALLL